MEGIEMIGNQMKSNSHIISTFMRTFLFFLIKHVLRMAIAFIFPSYDLLIYEYNQRYVFTHILRIFFIRDEV